MRRGLLWFVFPLALGACSSKPSGPVADYEKLAKELCGCSDIRCAKETADRMRSSARLLIKPDTSEGDRKRMHAADKKARACRREISRKEFELKFGKKASP